MSDLIKRPPSEVALPPDRALNEAVARGICYVFERANEMCLESTERIIKRTEGIDDPQLLRYSSHFIEESVKEMHKQLYFASIEAAEGMRFAARDSSERIAALYRPGEY